ncbi:MAG: general secretion pathway protein GspB [Gammaproteobacteria bacterium]|jgi:general secretion pathway protein B
MSYILDALKKSEQERGRGTAPGVQTMHSSSLNYHANKTQLWPYFLLAAVLVNLAALVYFIIAKPDTETSVQEPQKTAETQPAADAVKIERFAAASHDSHEGETIIYKPVSMPGTRQFAAAEPASVLAGAEYPQSQGAIMEKEELPPDMQQHIPVMEFSAHVYSSNPMQRSIVINGRFMEEGDRLTADLLLDEITADGAIFNFRGQRFHQGVVSAWN